MKKLLITGFDPFGGERINPSWEVSAGCRIVSVIMCYVNFKSPPYSALQLRPCCLLRKIFGRM